MTRKDYIIIATALRSAGVDEEALSAVTRALSRELLKDNERFDPARFWEECVGHQSSR